MVDIWWNNDALLRALRLSSLLAVFRRVKEARLCGVAEFSRVFLISVVGEWCSTWPRHLPCESIRLRYEMIIALRPFHGGKVGLEQRCSVGVGEAVFVARQHSADV